MISSAKCSPLVSILIPSYNAERWIEEAIASALQQTWENCEIVVVDDGSTDRTLEIAERFQSPKVKIHQQDNQGASSARNLAFELSSGDYVMWLDADDMMSSDKIERQVERIRLLESERFMISCGWKHFHYDPQRGGLNRNSLWADLTREEWLYRKLANNDHQQTATWLISRELALEAGKWDERMITDDDGDFFLRVLMVSNGVKFVEGPLVYYRRTPFGSWGDLTSCPLRLQAQWLSMQSHVRNLLFLEDSPRSREACINFLQRWFHHYYKDEVELVSEFESLASDLGGELQPPRLAWKYRWVQKIFGWSTAKWASQVVPQVKSRAIDRWERRKFDKSS
ncbi:MAG: glycosyltransferase family 2 protein [Verrucomicrobiae bacterium]|nr:glycosyltransferase family 2 protein [Verrucomicrobiae bacterium]